jgi:hypothetical protein
MAKKISRPVSGGMVSLLRTSALFAVVLFVCSCDFP